MLVLLVGGGTSPTTSGPPELEPVGFRPTASVTVTLDAEIYLRRLVDTAASRSALEDSLRVILEEHFGYVDWTADSIATHSVHVTIDQNFNGTKPSFLQLALSGWPQDSVLLLEFEQHGVILDRRDWSVKGIAAAWAGRLNELARDHGVALQQELMVDMPLNVLPQLVHFEALIPVPIDTLRAASSPHPEFMLKVVIVDSLPILSKDTASFYLRPCRSDGNVYACKIRLVEYLGISIDGPDVAAQLGQPDLALEPLTAHLWLYHPNQDPR